MGKRGCLSTTRWLPWRWESPSNPHRSKRVCPDGYTPRFPPPRLARHPPFVNALPPWYTCAGGCPTTLNCSEIRVLSDKSAALCTVGSEARRRSSRTMRDVHAQGFTAPSVVAGGGEVDGTGLPTHCPKDEQRQWTACKSTVCTTLPWLIHRDTHGKWGRVSVFAPPKRSPA